MRKRGWGVATLAMIAAACSPQTFADIGTAQAYTKDVVLPAVSSGGVEPLMSDYANKNADPVAQARWLRIYQELGPLQNADEVGCNVVASANMNADLSGTFADCFVQARYAEGAAVVTTRLRKVGDGWKIDALNVNSDVFGRLMDQALDSAKDTTDVVPDAPATPSP